MFVLCLPLHNELAVAVFSFLISFASVFNQNWLFQAFQELSKVAILNFISKLLFTLSVILLIRNEQDYTWQPLLTSTIQICTAIFSFVWAIKRYKIRLCKIPVSQVLVLLWSEKVVFFSMVLISLYTTTNTVVLGLFRPAQEVGYYTAKIEVDRCC
jgi:PST family polysaccharide transporter